MGKFVQRFQKNETGRDFIVGDIHGCFSKLESHLLAIGFNSDAGDRLFSVGDLVDRGPECDKALIWLGKPWFFAVAGNHEDMAIRWQNGNMDTGNYIANGGSWNVMNSMEQQLEFSDAFAELPIAIELETDDGLIGIVHANCPFDSWGEFVSVLNDESLSKGKKQAVIDSAQWSRERAKGILNGDIFGVKAVVVGHTPLVVPAWSGNVLHIDTAGWHPSGHGFTVINAETLKIEYAK